MINKNEVLTDLNKDFLESRKRRQIENLKSLDFKYKISESLMKIKFDLYFLPKNNLNHIL